MAETEPEIRLRRSPQKGAKSPVKSKGSHSTKQSAQKWGRSWDVSAWTVIGCLFMLAFCPAIVLFFWMCCDSFSCSVISPVIFVQEYGWERLVVEHFPKPTAKGFALYGGWMAFQAFLYVFLPGPIGYGQMTPAGHTLPYCVNGLLAWTVTHASFITCSLLFELFDPAIIADNWGPLMIAATAFGYLLTLYSWIKAHWFPSHPEDRKFSSSFIYDMFMGIEFNPRIGKYFDFKLFFNGRPGIVAWTLINFSFAAAQYRQLGYVTNSMLLLNFIHAVYVLDFFYHEDWYLRTIDIAHDHFGFYLAWGDTVWLPYMYTLQSHFLLRNRVDLSTPYFAFVFTLSMVGYYIFRNVNNQKDLARNTDGKCIIWGEPAKVIRTEFTTTNGEIHRSLLLTSGYWGDLLMSLAMCMACGGGFILPYFYIVYMTILLMQRVERDHQRCSGKYGKYWDQYCKEVPYKVLPYVY